MLPENRQTDYVTSDPNVAEALVRWGNLSPIVYQDGKWLAEGVISYFAGIHQIVRALDDSVPPGLPAHCFNPAFIAQFLGISVEELHYPLPLLDACLVRIESKLDKITVTERSDQSETPALSQRQYYILEALLEMDATSPDKRQPTKEIAKKAEGIEADPEGYKQPIADLAVRGLIGTKEGRGGGCWLTAEGKVVAEQL